ncbi:MAG: flagellar hook-basal body complex protein FliE [Treponema sp.]|jgi:flagellar hook-basal body complex protein FliE|nr:flagellar hook-basal body complex protein FliE [Treponema sp.]
MTLTPPSLVSVDTVALTVTDPKHIKPLAGLFPSGGDIIDVGKKIGAEAVTRDGSFDEMMLKALDKVSAQEQFSNELIQSAIVDPDAVDIHDITIAQAKASMSLNIARTVLNRLVQGWRDLINTR